MTPMEHDGGWTASARAYIQLQDKGDPNRTMLLDPVMLHLCADVRGLRVLDLGCGEGRFCRMLAERGASTVGVDLVREMVAIGRKRSSGDQAYVQASAEALPLRDGAFDLVVSYVTLVDIPDFRAAIAQSARVLKPGGAFVVANLGFVTASEGWLRDEAGNRLYHQVDRYAEERAQVYEWSGIKIRNWHRPLSSYMQSYLDAGLTLREFLEPVPPDDSLKSDPYFEDWYRVPLFTVMKWEKAHSTRTRGRVSGNAER